MHDARSAAAIAAGVAILSAGIVLRLHFSALLDPFEDGYQNWWISSNLLTTGQYWDRHSLMTQGNWLPLYHFFGVAVLGIADWHSVQALKLANIAVSAITALLVFQVGHQRSVLTGFAAMAFFTFNFIDVVISGWSTAESLATLFVFLGYAALFRFDSKDPRMRGIAAAAFTLAVLTRYEAWAVVGLVLLFVVLRKDYASRRREILWVLVPATAVMIGYFLYSLQWGFLPAIIVRQTSTDLRYQVSVGTQRSPIDLLAAWWSGYIWYFPLALLLGSAYAIRQTKRDVGTWIVLVLWTFVLLYSALQFGNPSYRYVMISVPFLSLFAAEGLVSGVRRLFEVRLLKPRAGGIVPGAVLAIAACIVVATMLPSPATFWSSGFVASRYMEPLERAGEFLSTRPLPVAKILVSESPIAAYFSGYPPDRILGARWLPQDRPNALLFLKQNAAFVVYMGVPYYTMRTLFPELQNGASTPDFELLFDAGGPQVGTHAIFVYRVVS